MLTIDVTDIITAGGRSTLITTNGHVFGLIPTDEIEIDVDPTLANGKPVFDPVFKILFFSSNTALNQKILEWGLQNVPPIV